jgi:hypothetical protein
VLRLLSFCGYFLVHSHFVPQLSAWYNSTPVAPVSFVVVSDLVCRLAAQTLAKPVRESLWVLIPKQTKYRAKIIVDVLAHRVGTSLAAFLSHVPIIWCVARVVASIGMNTQVIGDKTDASTGANTSSSMDVLSLERHMRKVTGGDHILWGSVASIAMLVCSLNLGAAFRDAKRSAKETKEAKEKQL